MCSLICARINGWVNNGEAGDLRRHRAHYDVIVMPILHFNQHWYIGILLEWILELFNRLLMTIWYLKWKRIQALLVFFSLQSLEYVIKLISRWLDGLISSYSLPFFILNQFGGYKPNDLNEKLSLYDEEPNETPTISLSPYLTNAMIPNYLKDYGHSFTVMSLNCQSINAKFGLLEAMLYELQQSDFAYSAICIQESWLSGNPPDMAAF